MGTRRSFSQNLTIFDRIFHKDKKLFFSHMAKDLLYARNFFFWKNNNNNHKYNYPKNILKKKKSYFFKINRKNSKIDRRTKSFGYDIKKILKDNQNKRFCPKVIINIFYEFFPAPSTISYKLPST